MALGTEIVSVTLLRNVLKRGNLSLAQIQGVLV